MADAVSRGVQVMGGVMPSLVQRRMERRWSGWFLGLMLCAAAISPSWADVYRCHLSDGRTTYQQVPCEAGRQVAIDEREAQARQKAEAEKRKEQERVARLAQQRREQIEAVQAELTRRAEAARESERKENEQSQKGWEGCASGRTCDSKCYAIGSALANVYLANQRQMLEYGFSATQYMNEGCKKKAGPGGDQCTLLCQDSFKDEIRQLGKR